MPVEVETSELICIDLDSYWCVKIVDNYGNIDYLPIKDNLKNKETIYNIADIFDIENHLILPPSKVDAYGNIVYWSVNDTENLYIINPVSPERWLDTEDPYCPKESEPEFEPCYTRDMEYNTKTDYYPEPDNRSNYFDELISNF